MWYKPFSSDEIAPNGLRSEIMIPLNERINARGRVEARRAGRKVAALQKAKLLLPGDLTPFWDNVLRYWETRARNNKALLVTPGKRWNWIEA